MKKQASRASRLGRLMELVCVVLAFSLALSVLATAQSAPDPGLAPDQTMPEAPEVPAEDPEALVTAALENLGAPPLEAEVPDPAEPPSQEEPADLADLPTDPEAVPAQDPTADPEDQESPRETAEPDPAEAPEVPALNPDPVVTASLQALTIDQVAVVSSAYNCDGSNYFKLRDLALLLSGTPAHFQVGFDPEQNAITIQTGLAYTPIGGELKKPSTPGSVQVSQQSLRINGEPVALDAYNIDGSNYFKLRDLGEALGFAVDYVAATNTAAITTGNPGPYPYAGVLVLTTTAQDGTVYYYNTYNGLEAYAAGGVYYKPSGVAMTADEQEDYLALSNARALLPELVNDQMTEAEKLKACFDWVLHKPYVTYRTFQQTAVYWPATYANDHFTRQGGDCHADAAAFAYLCRAMGYTDVWVCLDSDGIRAQGHSWAMVDGLYYDPLFAEAKDYASYFGVSSYPLTAITKLQVAIGY